MDFEAKIISREVSELLWEMEKTVGTAESCTGGRIAEAIIALTIRCLKSRQLYVRKLRNRW